MQFGTARPPGSVYTPLMFSENTKTLLFLAWSIAVIVGFIALGITSVLNWIVVACLAVAPPLVVRSVWRARAQTISASINEARR